MTHACWRQLERSTSLPETSDRACWAYHRSPMTGTLQPMLDLAQQALVNAHAPYSRFRVGACLRAAGGRLYAGCNVENSAYPVGQCAEATAIGAMVTAGDREIVEILV